MPPSPSGRILLLAAIVSGCSLAGGPSGNAPEPVGPRAHPGRESEVRVSDPGTGAGSPEARDAGDGGSEAEGSDIAFRVVATAYEAIGTPYEWGGNDRNGYDCSGLIRYAYGQYGIELPRISREQLRMGTPVELVVGALRPGDILGFSAVPEGAATHVGLYLGDGEFIHSSTSGVRISDLRQPYWQQHFIAARRMVR